MTVYTLIRVALELRAYGGVSAPERDPDGEVDRPIALDSWDRPYVPATSLAGSLRAHLGPEAGALFGSGLTDQDGRTGLASGPGSGDNQGDQNEDRRSSLLRFLGTKLVRPDPGEAQEALPIRRRTAIDRERAAAANHTLRVSEHLEPGTSITAYLRLDHPADHGALVEALVAAFHSKKPEDRERSTALLGSAFVEAVRRGLPEAGLDANQLRHYLTRTPEGRACLASAVEELLLSGVRTWQPYIGGGRTTGFGRAAVVELRRRTIDLNTAEGRRAWLTSGGPDLFADAVTTSVDLPDSAEPPAWFTARWEIVDGLHVGTGSAAEGSAPGPDTERSMQVAQVVRDHTGRPYLPGSSWKGVLRSRCEFILRSLGMEACLSGSPGDTCGQCLTCVMFGSAPQDERVRGSSVGRRGVLAFADSPVVDAEVVTRQHVAIDRVTGGARPRLLYSRETVQSGQLTLLVHDPGGSGGLGTDATVARALLTLACHDIHTGYVGLGGNTTRGMGTLRRIDVNDHALENVRTQAVDTLTAWRKQSPTQPAQPAEACS